MCHLNHSSRCYMKSVATEVYSMVNKSLQKISGRKARGKVRKRLLSKMLSISGICQDTGEHPGEAVQRVSQGGGGATVPGGGQEESRCCTE